MRLDGVIVEYGIDGKSAMSDRSVEPNIREIVTYAQTCEPTSGIIVNLTLSSSSRTQAILPMDDREAVNSTSSISRGKFGNIMLGFTGECLNISD